MTGVDELPSGKLEFVGENIPDVFEAEDYTSGERVEVLVQPVSSRDEFMDAVAEEPLWGSCEEVGAETVLIELSGRECEILLGESFNESLVETIELNDSVDLIQ